MKDAKILKYQPYLFALVLTCYNITIIKTKVAYNAMGDKINYLVPDELMFGAFGLTLVLVFIILKSQHWKPAFAMVLVIGLLKYLQFASWTTYLMNIEIVTALILVTHCSLNKEMFNPIKSILKKMLVLKEEPNGLDQDLINHFEKKFKHKTAEELNYISESDRYSHEAIEAASRLKLKTDQATPASDNKS